MPFMGAVTVDDFASGHAAALAGGTTMCVVMRCTFLTRAHAAL
jgi:dihydroorotase-like cyclic amidohydrolase